MRDDLCFDDDMLDGGVSLDLIKGHLRTVHYDYEQMSMLNHFELSNWAAPVGYVAGNHDYVATVQAFKNGGAELTLKSVDMLAVGAMLGSKQKTGTREKSEMTENDIARSVQRAKKKVRQNIKNAGCDRLLTLTRRENDKDSFWNEQAWLKAWRKFIRLCVKAGIYFDYVATLEPHKKGNYHLHAAISGHVHVNTIRKIWIVVNGGVSGCANVDVSFRKDKTPTERLAGVARYVSKYITKYTDTFGFNKKRYWSSRSDMPAAKKVVLKSKTFDDAFAELCKLLGLDCVNTLKKAFKFKSADGLTAAWFNYADSTQRECPF
jgi:hypothetical protein